MGSVTKSETPSLWSYLAREDARSMIAQALHEDVRDGDVTTLPTIPPEQQGRAKIIAKQDGILCGSGLIGEVFQQLDASVAVDAAFQDGDALSNGDTVFRMQGPMATILTGERVILNFLGMLSGVATVTSRYAQAIAHTNARVLDTRKTTPLHRMLEKYAVVTGGGCNHRIGLFDMVLIKENHIDACGGIDKAVQRVREKWGDTYAIEVETRSLDEVRHAIEAKADRIMLDNMEFGTMREAVAMIDGRAEIEASGNVTLESIGAIAETGVDFVSVGRLTHSTPWFDFSLLIDND